MNTFGIEITVENPAAEARAELGELKALLNQVEHGLKAARGKPGLWQRVKAALTPRPSTPSTPSTGSGCRVISEQARQVMDGDPLFLDYETTGLNRKSDRVVEVSVIDGRGRVLLSTLVNPQRPISPAASAVNGIFDADVADAPTWREVEPALRRLLAGRVVVAHNAEFDAKFTPFEVNWVCSKVLANEALGKADWLDVRDDWRVGGSLAARLLQLGLPAAQEHTAAGDCLSTLRLMRRLAGIPCEAELVY